MFRAAKAKEREASLALFAQQVADFIGQRLDTNMPLWKSDIIALAKPEALAEHDAKIRREAYLRCANAASERDYKLINDFNNAKNEPSLTYMFDKWANEADGGGK